MLTRIKKWLNVGDSTSRISLSANTISLPADGLSNVIQFYESYSGDRIPIILAVIYNVEQLAMEIAQHLENGTSKRGEGDKNGNQPPMPT